jgi:hypothetical protein
LLAWFQLDPVHEAARADLFKERVGHARSRFIPVRHETDLALVADEGKPGPSAWISLHEDPIKATTG